ncbi:DUF2637 domain-containing protein [Streptomyces sp. NPDC004311]|uniref:DUF2637 domain-containing protein n=1 Tax=Streptomyces sp. NPDC004311 TaxID=3364698 RepID=UPI00369FCBE6
MTTQTAERYVLIAAGTVIVALTAAGFWLSYAHLAEVAGLHGLGSSPIRQWAWPATLDAFIVTGELLMLRAGLRRVTDWWAIALTATGSVGSIVLNVAGVSGTGTTPVPLLNYVVAAIPPTAALLAFGVLMRQLHQLVATPQPGQRPNGDRAQAVATPGPAAKHEAVGDRGVPDWDQDTQNNGDQVYGTKASIAGDRPHTTEGTDHGPLPDRTTTVPVPNGDRPHGSAHRAGGDRTATAGTVPHGSDHGPRSVPNAALPQGDRAYGTGGSAAGDRPRTEGTVPGTGHGPLRNRTATAADTGLGPQTVPVPRAAVPSGDRPRNERTLAVPGTGDRLWAGLGTDAEGPRPHPVPEGDKDGDGDRDEAGDGDRSDGEDDPATGDRGPNPATTRPRDRARDRSRTPRGPRPRTGRGPRSRTRLSEDEIVDLLRPHVPAALKRDGNESITRVQLRQIMREHSIPIRNDRLTPVLARLRDENAASTTRSSAR